MNPFSFLDPIVRFTLERERNKEPLYMGSAISDFQSHPHEYVNTSSGIPRNDWETYAHSRAAHASLPKFFDHTDLYVARSNELGERMFRISFDFGKLCPTQGQFDLEQMKIYIRTLASVRARGLEPMVTLYHWPNPNHLVSYRSDGSILKGAWEHEEFLERFTFYVEEVLKSLSDPHFIKKSLEGSSHDSGTIDAFADEGLVRYFITINEPINIFLPTYLAGLYPPFKKFRFDLVPKVVSKIVEAHTVTIKKIREANLPTRRGAVEVGIAHSWVHFEGLLQRPAHAIINAMLTRALEKGAYKTDFIGLNYYFRMKVPRLSRRRSVFSDNPYFGDIFPQGVSAVLQKMHKEYPNKPIFITEFGFSDTNDLRRPFWILETLRHVIEAMGKSIPVKGMLLWSLVDSFEWDLGMSQKFGLFAEHELQLPLSAGQQKISSWEVWQLALRAIASPTEQNLYNLQRAYERSRTQFIEAIKS